LIVVTSLTLGAVFDLVIGCFWRVAVNKELYVVQVFKVAAGFGGNVGDVTAPAGFFGQAWHSVRPPGQEPWMPGNTFCYRKSLWQARPFDDRQVGSDILFLRQRSGRKIISLRAIGWLVDMIHGENVSAKNSQSPQWRPYPAAEIEQLLGPDWPTYAQLEIKR
jgi:hypothetical protein